MSSTQALNQAFQQKLDQDQIERAQVKISSIKRKMQMALAQAKRNQSDCCDSSSTLQTAKSDAEAFEQLLDQNLRRLSKAAVFAMSKAAAAITVFAFQVAAKTVLEQQERQKPHLPRRSVHQDTPKA